MTHPIFKTLVERLGALKSPYTHQYGLEMTGDAVDDYVKRDNLSTYKKASMPAEVEGDEIPF